MVVVKYVGRFQGYGSGYSDPVPFHMRQFELWDEQNQPTIHVETKWLKSLTTGTYGPFISFSNRIVCSRRSRKNIFFRR